MALRYSIDDVKKLIDEVHTKSRKTHISLVFDGKTFSVLFEKIDLSIEDLKSMPARRNPNED